MTGLHLAQYRIDAELGRGGMGIVYLATDTKLNRQVAIKVLPAAVISSQDDRARFFREAQAAAQLHHPHIATVFQIDEAVPVEDGKEPQPGAEPRLFIAMEYIDGETLQQRAARSPLALPEAVSIATQMGEALRTAHAKNIVHRDIKSANVMLTKDGIAKVLDFGLAKTNQSTMLTRMGSTLGTVAYMSPEQARGQEVDGRSDLYSLGTVLYEMIAGRLPFSADYEQAVLYSILNEPPEPLTSVRTGVPMQLEWIVNKLLSKEADYRYQTAGDLLADLKSLSLGGSGNSRRTMAAAGTAVGDGSTGVLPISGSASNGMPMWGWAVIGVALVAGAVGAWMAKPGATPAPDAVIRTTLDLGISTRRIAASAVSPSGRLFAWSDMAAVHVRDLQTSEEWEIPESNLILHIAFNTDETWMLLDRPGRILRTQVRGGKPLEVAAVRANTAGAIWGPDETVVFASAGDLFSLSLAGGEPTLLSPADSSRFLDEPFLTDDGKTLIVSVETASGLSIGVYDFPSGRLRGELAIRGLGPKYIPTGHLVYVEGDALMAVPVTLDPPALVGPPIEIAGNTRAENWSVSRNGHAFIAPGGTFGSGDRLFERWYFDGRIEPTRAPAGSYDDFAVSPTNPDLVVVEQDAEEGGQSVWVVDLSSGVPNRLTFGDQGDDPVWHPSGDSVIFVDRARGDGPQYVVLRAADGSGEPRDLVAASGRRIGQPKASRSFDRVVFKSFYNPDVIEMLDVSTGEVSALVTGADRPDWPDLSPDGRYVIYDAEIAPGERRVWMQPVPANGSRWDLSRILGYRGEWSPDGDAVYFRTPDGIAKVAVSTAGGRVSIGNPSIVLDHPGPFVLLPDGSGVIVNRAAGTGQEQGQSVQVQVIFNWTAELSAIAPNPR